LIVSATHATNDSATPVGARHLHDAPRASASSGKADDALHADVRLGDSYSDIGAGHIDGNGPTAVAYLGWLMGLKVTSSKAVDATDKSLVFAVSGAGTGEGEGRRVKDALLGYGMLNQVRDFAARVKSGSIAFDPQTTLFSWPAGSTTASARRRLRWRIFNSRFASFASSVGVISLSPCSPPRFRSSRPSGFG
jgi:hypothetical protein